MRENAAAQGHFELHGLCWLTNKSCRNNGLQCLTAPSSSIETIGLFQGVSNVTDQSEHHRALLEARDSAIELRQRRPDLKTMCNDLIKNIELQLRNPGDADLIRAYSKLYAEIQRRVPPDTTH